MQLLRKFSALFPYLATFLCLLCHFMVQHMTVGTSHFAGKSLSGNCTCSCSLILIFGSGEKRKLSHAVRFFGGFCCCCSVFSSHTGMSFTVVFYFLVINRTPKWLAPAEKAHKGSKLSKTRTFLAHSKMPPPPKMLNWEIAETGSRSWIRPQWISTVRKLLRKFLPGCTPASLAD